MSCGVVHPEYPEVKCYLNTGNHPEHTGMDIFQKFIDWVNDAYVPSATRASKGSSPNKKVLKDMATRIRGDEIISTYLPTEADTLGRTALYLLKYLNEWITLEELEHKLVAGSAAQSRVQQLIHMGWPIDQSAKGAKFRLKKDPRKSLAEAAK